MAIKAIIFDLDGVICHTDEYHYLAWKTVADNLGIEFNRAINNRLRGVSRMESLDIILEKYDGKPLAPETLAALAGQKNDIYRTMLYQMGPDDLSDEVKETLEALRGRGYKLAIGSSSKNAPLILERIGLEDFFDAISDGNNISKSKPDPEVFLKAADFIGEKPGNCLVVEDALAGVEAAAAGGFLSASIGDAANEGAGDYILNRFSDLQDIVSGI